jgi:hypothetical protein
MESFVFSTGIGNPLQILPLPEIERRPLVYYPDSWNEPNLVTLLGQLSALLTRRMREQLQAGLNVRWTDQIRFLPEGLEYPDPDPAKCKQVIPYNWIRVSFPSGLRSFTLFDGTPLPLGGNLGSHGLAFAGAALLEQICSGEVKQLHDAAAARQLAPPTNVADVQTERPEMVQPPAEAGRPAREGFSSRAKEE